MINQDWQDEFERLFLSVNESDIEYLKTLKNKNIPSKLYKYRKVDEYSLDCLFNKQVWCDNLNKYNDLYEGYIYYNSFLIIKDYFKNLVLEIFNQNNLSHINKDKILYNISNATSKDELIESIGIVDKHVKEHFQSKYDEGFSKFEALKKEIIKTNQEMTKICSFSSVKPFDETNNDNQLLWAHYGDSYKGFCVEYDTTDLNKSDFYPVDYSKILDITQDLSNAMQGVQPSPLFRYYIPRKKI